MLSSPSRRLAGIALMVLALAPAVACDDTDAPTAPVVPPEAAAVTQADRDAVTAAVSAIDPTWAAMDPARFAANFSTDARYIGPTGALMNSRAAIEQVHTNLFGGPFRGSRRTATVDDVLFLSSVTAVVERTVDLTGYVAVPPGLQATQPGIVRTRERLILQKRSGSWTVVRGQLTAIPPS